MSPAVGPPLGGRWLARGLVVLAPVSCSHGTVTTDFGGGTAETNALALRKELSGDLTSRIGRPK